MKKFYLSPVVEDFDMDILSSLCATSYDVAVDQFQGLEEVEL